MTPDRFNFLRVVGDNVPANVKGRRKAMRVITPPFQVNISQMNKNLIMKII